MNPTSAIADGYHALNQYLVRVEEAGWKAALKEARPAAYGDFIAGVLAIIATVALSKRDTWAIVALWAFNIWGAADLLFAFYQGARVQLDPGTLGAAFFIVTAIELLESQS